MPGEELTALSNANIEPTIHLLPEELNELLKEHNMSTFLCFNVRSISQHFDDLTNLLSTIDSKFSGIILTETHLHKFNKELFAFPEFDGFHVQRSKTRGGGVSIFIKKSLKAKEIISVINEDIELFGLTFQNGNKKGNILGIYRPPQGSRPNFITILDETCNTILKSECSIIAGDFNIDVSTDNKSYCSKRLLDTMRSNGFINLVTNITRPSTNENNSTIIDHIYYNRADHPKTYTLQTDITDHFPCILALASPGTSPKSIKIPFRVVSDKRKNLFINQLRSVDFNFIKNNNTSLEEKLKTFEHIIYDSYNSHFPIKYKTVTEKRIKNKWLTKSLMISIKEKHRLLKGVKEGTIHMEAYKTYSSLLKKIIRKSKAIFFKNKFKQSQSDMRSTWATINEILSRGNENQTPIEELTINNETVTDRQVIVNELNSYFTSIGSTLTKKIPQTEKSFQSYLDPPGEHTFSFTSISSKEVQRVIKTLKNKNTDVNTVPNWAYKFCSQEISPVLATLFNDSLLKGHFPAALKTARITPIQKSSKNSQPENFRPISILSTISKIFEKLVHSQFTMYPHENELLSQTQFGFMKNCNTEDALIYLTENIYKALDKKHTCDLLLLDFSKAFDVVSHDILLNKLNRLGVTNKSLAWFKTYLEDRNQYTRLGNTTSPLTTITHGVSQGSVIGPLLFNIYTNDFRSCHQSLHSQYADDTAILITDNNLRDLNIKVNEVLHKIITWVEANKLCLNLQKSQYLVISNSKSPIKLEVRTRDVIIKRTSYAKLLGIIRDDKLSFKKHINSVVSKLSYANYALLKLKSYVQKSILKSIYYSLAYPHLLYSISIWGTASEYLLPPLETMHKEIIRSISRAKSYYEHTKPLFKNLSLLKIPEILTLSLTNQIYKTHNGMACKTLSTIIESNQTIRRANLRGNNSHALTKSKFTLSKSRRAISYHIYGITSHQQLQNQSP